MAGVMAALHYLTGKPSYREKAEAILGAFSGELQRNFFPLSTLLNASETLQTAQQVVVVGGREDPEVAALLHACYATSSPDRLLQVVDPASGCRSIIRPTVRVRWTARRPLTSAGARPAPFRLRI